MMTSYGAILYWYGQFIKTKTPNTLHIKYTQVYESFCFLFCKSSVRVQNNHPDVHTT